MTHLAAIKPSTSSLSGIIGSARHLHDRRSGPNLFSVTTNREAPPVAATLDADGRGRAGAADASAGAPVPVLRTMSKPR
jgi:hypothetical protein